MNVILTTLNAKYIHSSLALRYLRSYCRDEFPHVQLVEYTINDVTMNIVGDLFNRHPDVVAFSCYIWNIRETIDVIKNLKKVKPEVTIILGGPEVSYDTAEWMEKLPEVDAIVIGEGEHTFLELLRELKKHSSKNPSEFSLQEIEGIAYRKRDDQGEMRVRFTRPRAKIEDLNTIHSPFEDHLDELKNRIVYFEASRGCPFRCQFCLSSIEEGVRYFDIERVKRDLKRLIDHGIKTIKFVDRTFNIHKKYAMEIFQFLIENHNGTVFQFEITADIMKPDVVDYLVENAPPGIFRFEVGVQSTNEETNRLVMRRQNFEKLSRTVTKIKEAGKFTQHLDLIAGLPEEDYPSFRKTFNDVFALKPEELQLGFLKMLRGTGVRARAVEHGYIYMDEAPYEILQNNVLSFAEILRLKRLEDILEKYWNDHRMDRTLLFLLENEFETPFDFFQEYGDYWDDQGWGRIGHQLHDLYVRLHKFLSERGMKNPDLIHHLMQFDYLVNQRTKPRTVWWTPALNKKEQQEMYGAIVADPNRMKKFYPTGDDRVFTLADLNLTEKELHKHTVLEKTTTKLREYLENGTMANIGGGEEGYMLVYYPPHHHGTSDRYENVPSVPQVFIGKPFPL